MALTSLSEIRSSLGPAASKEVIEKELEHRREMERGQLKLQQDANLREWSADIRVWVGLFGCSILLAGIIWVIAYAFSLKETSLSAIVGVLAGGITTGLINGIITLARPKSKEKEETKKEEAKPT